VIAATFVQMANYPVPPVVTASILGKVFLWLPDQGLKGFMHYTINGVENLPTATSSYLRYIDAEIGRGRFNLRTEPVAVEDGNPSTLNPLSPRLIRRPSKNATQ